MADHPDWSRALVPAEKARFYLGLIDDPKSRGRGTAFVDYLGFRDVAELRAAIAAHARSSPARLDRVTRHGRVYDVVGPMSGPSGRWFVHMLTVWIVHPGRTTPFNVTALPVRKPKE